MAICVGCGLDVDDSGKLIADTCTDGGLGCGNTAGDTQCLHVKLAQDGGISYDPAATDQNGNPGGLRVGFPANTPGGSGSTNLGSCLQTDADGKINIRLDATPAGCNGAQCTSEGLFVPCNQGIHDIDQAVGTTTFTPDAGLEVSPGTFRVEGTRNWQICNPGCCALQGRLVLEAGGFAIEMQPGFLGKVRFVTSRDGGATWSGIFPEHFEWCDNRIGANTNPRSVMRKSLVLYHETTWIDLPVNHCETVICAYEVIVEQGSAVVGSFGAFAGFELHLDATPIGCDTCTNISTADANSPFAGSLPPGHTSTRSLSYVCRGSGQCNFNR